MSITVEPLEGLKKRMKVVLEPKEIELAYNKQLNEYAKTAKLKGFRPGKVPLSILEKQVGANLRFDVAAKLMESSFSKALQEKKIKIVGQPSVEPGELKKDQPFEYTATFEVYPEIELKTLEGATLEIPKAEVVQKDVDEMLKNLQKQHATWNEVSREATEGDKLVVDFEGTINGEVFSGNSANNFSLELGSKRMIPGFEEALIGMQMGEESVIDVDFPKDYHVKDLAGKKAQFKVKVHKVEEMELPELNDAFAKVLKIEGGIEAVKKDIQKTMESNLEKKIFEIKKTRVLNQLLKKNSIDAPNALIDMEISHMQEMTKRQYQQWNGKEWPKDQTLSREPYLEQATKQVKLGLLLSKFIELHSVKVDEKLVDAKLKEITKGYDDANAVIEHYRQNNEWMSQIKSLVLENQVVDQLLGTIAIEEKSDNYQSVMKLSE